MISVDVLNPKAMAIELSPHDTWDVIDVMISNVSGETIRVKLFSDTHEQAEQWLAKVEQDARTAREQIQAARKAPDADKCPKCGHDRKDEPVVWTDQHSDGRSGTWHCNGCDHREVVEQEWGQ
jgi:hypothetical protein